MPRKHAKGYFVRGHFVAEGSELDQALKRELKGETGVSKSDLKRESERLQSLGESLLTLRSGLFARLSLPDALRDALDAARRISDFEGRRRQLQYVGKLMRKLDEDAVQAIEAALREQREGSAADTQQLHQAEHWRDRLLADDDALGQWLREHPDTDAQHLRSLLRQARKEAQPERPGEARRHGKAYREVFQLVRAALSPDADADADAASSAAPHSP